MLKRRRRYESNTVRISLCVHERVAYACDPDYENRNDDEYSTMKKGSEVDNEEVGVEERIEGT